MVVVLPAAAFPMPSKRVLCSQPHAPSGRSASISVVPNPSIYLVGALLTVAGLAVALHCLRRDRRPGPVGPGRCPLLNDDGRHLPSGLACGRRGRMISAATEYVHGTAPSLRYRCGASAAK